MSKSSKSQQKDPLAALLDAKQLEPYIRYIRFPQYKNFFHDTRIEFTYPITAIVGANGTNKSSVIKALWATKEGNNLGGLWFSTSLDPIQETDGWPSSFIYGYWNDAVKKVVEVLQTRVHDRVDGDPDLWETSRPVQRYNMERMPPLDPHKPIPKGRSKTRWNNVNKEVIYIDFRDTISAFDKYFYHGKLTNRTESEKRKKQFIRRRTPHLQQALSDMETSHSYYGTERIINQENHVLEQTEVEIISHILGRQYLDIHLVHHSFFDCDGYTCLMRANNLRYTEAFAGSGEFAVAQMVYKISRATERSLILMDEPEVSLHPGAQKRLIEYLFNCVKQHKHQIVISTHSPAIIRHLPPTAIKIFAMDPNSGMTRLLGQSATPEQAFFQIGEPVNDKTTVIVEDALARELLHRVLRDLDENIANLFEVQFFPGGVHVLWEHYLPFYAAENRQDILVLIDGDKKPSEPMKDPNMIAPAQSELLKSEIHRVTEVDIPFYTDGRNEDQQNDMRRNFMTWVRENVSYLPGNTPEDFIWDNMKHDEKSKIIKQNLKSKLKFEALARAELGLTENHELNSKDILQTQRRRIATIPNNNSGLIEIREFLLDVATSSSQNERVQKK